MIGKSKHEGERARAGAEKEWANRKERLTEFHYVGKMSQ
jgi:hypothetical protein